jgi:hypothetical protein
MLEALGQLLPNGLRRGEIVEIVGPPSGGRFSMAMALLGTSTTLGEAAALVDLGDHFDPRAAALTGVRLERLLWLRPRHLKEAFAATEITIQGGFPFIVLDLGTPPVPGGRGAQSSWVRLLKDVREHETALLVASPYPVCGSAATTAISTGKGRGCWQGASLHRLLQGLTSTLIVRKARGRRHGVSSRLLLRPWLGGVAFDEATAEPPSQLTEQYQEDDQAAAREIAVA